MTVDLIYITEAASEHIEYCARRCYSSQGKVQPGGHLSFVRKCVMAGHRSILRHATATFEVKGISRVCSHQLVRCKHLDYLQESQRYVVAQPSWNPTVADAEVGYMAHLYEERVKTGTKKEDARYILPQAIHTSMVVSGNFHAWFDFLRLRLSRKTQQETRDVAKEIYRTLNLKCPNVFNPEVLLHQPKLELEFE